MKTSSRFVAIVAQVTGLWRRGPLRRLFQDAQLALGERMVAAGIDDGQTRPRIAALEQRIRLAEAQGLTTRALKAERTQLVLLLAAAALEEDAPLPGAEVEFEKAKEAQQALQACTADSNTQKEARVFAPREPALSR